MLTKQEIIKIIQLMPDSKFSNIEDVLDEIILHYKIQSGLKNIGEDKVHSEAEVDKIINRKDKCKDWNDFKKEMKSWPKQYKK